MPRFLGQTTLWLSCARCRTGPANVMTVRQPGPRCKVPPQSGHDQIGQNTANSYGICSGDSSAIRYARHEHLLQHVALNRLLQNRNVAKSRIDAVDIVSRYEHEWYAADAENFGDSVNQSIAEIDVEHRGVKMALASGGKRLGCRA